MNPVAGIFMPWWGAEPSWAREFIERSLCLESLDAILVGDAAEFAPDLEVPRIPCTMDRFEELASAAAGVQVRKHDPRYFRGQALCELRPMMADVFPEAVASYPWWGYGDWDVVWGDWDQFLPDLDLSLLDIISTNARTINGPLTLFRNVPEIVKLYQKRLDLVASPHAHWLDESGMQEIVAQEKWVRCLYLEDLNMHDRHQVWNRCCLRGNKLFRMDRSGRIGSEIMKFHFPAAKDWPL